GSLGPQSPAQPLARLPGLSPVSRVRDPGPRRRDQERTHTLMNRSAAALLDMLDAVSAARKAGASEAQLAEVLALQRKAQWRLDFVAAENSVGFHPPQETAPRVADESAAWAR